MSKRLDVLKAVMARAAIALPGADILGLDGDEAAPARVSPLGRVVVRTGDMGQPQVDIGFGQPIYNWDHTIPLEFTGYTSTSMTSEDVLDDMLVAFGEVIADDPTLGGLCDYVEMSGPTTDNIYVDGARPPRGGDISLVASYSTTTPLT